MTVRILQGDCVEVMRTLPECSVDSIVTDPPYGIGFMGKAWDGADITKRMDKRRAMTSHAPDAGPNGGHKSAAAAAGLYDLSPAGMLAFQEFSEAWAREAMRVLKPGGYLLSFASTRTYHRMTCGIEAAGFEIRDQIGWAFGSGFPKSHNGPWGGTALKPAWEPICVARKPLIGTVEANWREHSTGALNIDGCRVLVDGEERAPITGKGALPTRHSEHQPREAGVLVQPNDLGRWPANLIHDGSDEVLAAFPQAPGQIARARTDGAAQGNNVLGALRHVTKEPTPRGDAGSAARFFYCAKADRADRNEGLQGMPERPSGMVSNTGGQHITRRDGGAPKPAANHHPTVKPTDLMRYLCRLVTPPGGVVLDPFMGSGSTLKAAELEGFSAIGIELDPTYIEIARRRIAADAPLFAEVAA
ncbi:DNA-methyltransferase [Methylibium petroleiphilum]